MPVAKYDASTDLANATSDQRRQREAKHRGLLARPLQDPGAEPGYSPEHIIVGEPELEGLPLNATAIVTATVTSSRATLTEDKTGIYSSFDLSITEILKQDNTFPIQVGSVIQGERQGGAVQFPSGRVESYRYRQQHFPSLGDSYILFLARPADASSYYIYTAYQINAGLIEPLDEGVNCKKFAGQSVTTFKALIRNGLTKSGGGTN